MYKPYPKYKESGVAWLGEVPEGWGNYRIDWISTIIRGNTGFKKDELLDNGEYVALQYGKTYKVDEINKKFDFYVNSKFYKLSQVVHHGDTILISTSETIEDLGHSCFYNRNDLGLIGGEQILLKPNVELTSEKYLYYASKVFCNELRRYATGLKVFRFNIDDLKNIFLSIPLVEEQTQIATYLDQKTKKIDTLIEKQQTLIELLKEKRQALISHVVTKGLDTQNNLWKNYRLDWVTTIVRGNSSFKKDELLKAGKYVALQYGKTYKVDEVNEEFDFYVNDEFYKLSQVVDYGNTILISTSETIEDLGHSCFYNRNDLGLIGGEQILLKPNNRFIDGRYLYYKSKVFSTELKKYATGLKVFRFNIDDLKNTFISIPKVEEQTQIANYLDQKTKKIDTLIEKSKQSIELLKERRTALISAVVTGKVDVRE
ncbi:restriction endonuclease subunit S [bacterium]|nr:restriction endonuclease subunit S [bacterium]MBU1957980.1 restriction endonuclease subunit S [bacterium]